MSGSLEVETYVSASSFTGSLDYDNLVNVPEGLVSSSDQINTGSFSGSFFGDGSGLTGIDGFPFTGSAEISGSLIVDGTVTASFFSGDGSGLTNVTAELTTVTTFAEPFTSQSNITIFHNLDTIAPIVQVYDENDEQLIPAKIKIVDSGSVLLEFAVETSGNVVVAKAGHIIESSGLTYKVQDFTNTSNVTVSHGFDTLAPIVQVYDDSGSQILPDDIVVVDANSVQILFTENYSGKIAVSKGGHVIDTDGATISGEFSGSFTGSFTPTEDILPSVTDQIDIGSPTNRFKDIYLSGSTIFLGNVKLTESEEGTLKIVDASETEVVIGEELNLRLDSLESESGSVRTDFNNYTSSADERLGSLEVESGSIRTELNNYTSSADNRLASLEIESGSIRTALNNYTSSADGRLSSLETESGSVRTTFNNYTSSADGRLSSIEVESGSIRTDFNNFTSSIDSALTITNKDVVAKGDLTITGDLLVQGTQSIFNTEQFSVENNIIELNVAGAIKGGILVGDITEPSQLSGSLLWDGMNDHWIAGISGSEEKIVLDGSFNAYTSSINTKISSLEIESGSIRTALNNFTGSSGVVSGSGQIDINSTTGTLNVNKGGTGQTSYTDGQLLIGNTVGNTLTKATLSGTTDRITISNGNGSITINADATSANNVNKIVARDSSGNFSAGTINATFSGSLNSSAATITGGSINGAPIGAGTASTGAFTTLTASSTATLNTLASSGATITGGSINGTTIGATTASTGAFTTLSATSAITGPTTTNTINGLIINSGALSGVTNLTASGTITGTVAYSNTTSGLQATTVQAAIDETRNLIAFALVVHGTNSNVARPAGQQFITVYWRGTAIPANPLDGDLWDETQTFYSPDAGLWTYDGSIGLWVKGTDTVSVDWVSDHTVGAGGTVELNFGTSSGDRTIDWGDGTVAVVNTARPSHTYTNAGTYQVRASGGTTVRLGDRDSSPVATWTGTLTRVRSWGNLGWTLFASGLRGVSGNFGVPRYVPSLVTNMASMFQGASAFNQPIGSWNTANVTTMSSMFSGASAFNQPIGSWNTANVTTMSSMFTNTSAFNQPIGSWNTANVTNLSEMFFSGTAFNQPIGSWNTANVTTMSSMFTNALAFNQPIGSWNTANVTNLSSMFRRATAFNQDISGWNVSAVTTMDRMFQRDTAGTSAFNQDLGAWQLRLAGVNMTAMFDNTAGSNSLSTENYSRTLIGWANYVSANSNTPANVTLGAGTRTYDSVNYTTGQTYNNAGTEARAALIAAGWTITDGGGTVLHGTNSNFLRPAGSTQVLWVGTAIPANPVGGDTWDETQTFFSPDAGLWTYDGSIGLWVKGTDTVSVDWVSDHTVGAGGSVELNFGTSSGDRTIDWGDGSTPVVVNTARPTHTYTNAGTYQVRASGGTTIRLGDRGASPVAAWTGTLTRVRSWGNLGWTNFQVGFQSVSGNFGVPRYVPSTVTNMSSMFRIASAFNQPIGSWNTANVTTMATMFNQAAAFNQDIGAWNTANVTTMANMFQRAGAFNQDISGWNVSAVSDMSNMFRRDFAGTNAFNQDLGAWQLRLAGVNMTGMFDNPSGSLSLSTENYSRTLIGWANYVSANSNTPANVTLGAGNRTYDSVNYTTGQTYNNAGTEARAALIAAGWTITDGGGTVLHGTDSNFLRPAGSTQVLWVGTAIPANPLDGDLWDETQTFYSPDAGLWTYDGSIGLWVKGTDTVSVDWVSDHTVGAGGSVELNFGTSSGDRTIDWGDGSTPVVVNTARPTHTYTNAGTYQVRASGGTTTRLGDRGTSPVAAWTGTLQRVRSWGNLGWTSFAQGFRSVSGNFGVPRYLPSTVTNISNLFREASAFNQPIGSWNTANVTDMANMFRDASAFNQDIGSWNTANVTAMSDMFRAATAFNQPIGLWNTANVTDMGLMFQQASVFNQDISGWDVRAVSNMTGMFRRTIAGANAFNQDLGAWQLRLAGVDMTNMFAGSLSLSTENYSRTLIGWANYVDANSDTPANVTLGGGDRTYNNTAYVSGQTYNDAVAARAYLVGSPPDWIITDGGQV